MAPAAEAGRRKSALRWRSAVDFPHWARGYESEEEIENDQHGIQRRKRLPHGSNFKVDELFRRDESDAASRVPDDSDNSNDSDSSDESEPGKGPGTEAPPAKSSLLPPPPKTLIPPPGDDSTVRRPRITLTAALPEYTDAPDSPQVVAPAQPTRAVTSTSTLSFATFTTADAAYSTDVPRRAPNETPVVPSTTLASQTTSAPKAIATAARDGAELARPAGMNPREKALIASGSIVGAIILIALAWFVWRSSDKKSARRYSVWQTNFFQRTSKGPRRVLRNLRNKVPFFKESNSSNSRGWTNLDDDDSHSDDFFANEKHAAAATAAGVWNEKSQGPQEKVRINSYGMVIRKPLPRESMPDLLAPDMLIPPLPSPTAPPAVVVTAAANDASTEEAQLNNTPLPKDTDVPYRLSEISSLSSGFGDGDFLIPPSAAVTKPPRTRVVEPTTLASITEARNTTSAAAEDPRNGDTVYTVASEDSPPRYRTVNSWVKQQVGRVKRAEQRAAEAAAGGDEAPPVPGLPPSPGLDMMMPDGEEPRRVDVETLGSNVSGDESKGEEEKGRK